MTLSPTEDLVVIGVPGDEYRVGPYCSNPTCTRVADHVHHIWRRSLIGGDYRWVVIDGEVIANLTGLCYRCHADVTGDIGGHMAAIRFEPEERAFYWDTIDKRDRHFEVGPLDPQPPTPEQLAARASGHTQESTCPLCGQQKRRRSSPRPPRPGGPRRKTWTVRVPDDEQENGADVLDTLVDDLAPLFGYDATASARYYVLSHALYYAQQNRRQFVEAIRGVGG